MYKILPKIFLLVIFQCMFTIQLSAQEVGDDDGLRGQLHRWEKDLPGMDCGAVARPDGNIMDGNDLVAAIQVDGDEMLPGIVADEGAE